MKYKIFATLLLVCFSTIPVTIFSKEPIEFYDDFDDILGVEKSTMQARPFHDEEYISICSSIPLKPAPKWRVLVNRFGSSVVVRYIAVKKYVNRLLSTWKKWLFWWQKEEVKTQR